MRLTKWGHSIMMAKACTWCGVGVGKPCREKGMDAASNWPHGIHYGRESGNRGDAASANLHFAIPSTPVDGDSDPAALYMAAVLRLAP